MKKGTKHRTLTFNDRPVKVCMSCTSREHKVIKNKYRNCKIDCSICSKKVMHNNCILCHNCDHFVHNKCAKIDKKDADFIEKHTNNWFCPTCIDNIFPLINDDSLTTDKRVGNTVKRKPKVAACQCFVCTEPIPKRNYVNKRVLYDSILINLCMNCSKADCTTLKVKDKSLVEFLDCPACEKIVLYESILCSLCQHWAHPTCHDLNLQDIKTMSTNEYGDWICTTCLEQILPLNSLNSTNITESIITEKQITDNLSTHRLSYML